MQNAEEIECECAQTSICEIILIIKSLCDNVKWFYLILESTDFSSMDKFGIFLLHTINMVVICVAKYPVTSEIPRSSKYTEEHCHCAYYEELDWIGPFCEKWIRTDPPFCFLSGRADGKVCPGATQNGNTSVYWTEDETICNRSRAKHPILWNLSLRQPLTSREILTIFLYCLNILIGTIGNGLVVKYFAFGRGKTHTGSRFVAILAGVDCLTSIWIPGFLIVDNLHISFYSTKIGNLGIGHLERLCAALYTFIRHCLVRPRGYW